jgi:hypothetical protein
MATYPSRELCLCEGSRNIEDRSREQMKKTTTQKTQPVHALDVSNDAYLLIGRWLLNRHHVKVMGIELHWFITVHLTAILMLMDG